LSPLTKDHLAELREELEAQLARLRRSIEASEAALEPVELDQSRVGRLSRVAELQNQSLTRNLHEREEIRLTLVRNAIARMEEGTYGLCADPVSTNACRTSHTDGRLAYPSNGLRTLNPNPKLSQKPYSRGFSEHEGAPATS